jgi:hypothetical protein
MIYLKLLASTLLVLVLSSESPGRYETNISGAGNTGHDLSSAGIKSDTRYFKSENPYSINITGNKTVSEYTKPGEILFTEAFEDTAIFSRGWYDNHNIQISYSEHVKGSKASAEFHFPAGATTPVSGGSIRHKFKETESVCVSYYVKHSENWTGSDRNYHPHEFYLLTNVDGDYSNLAFTHLTAYIEENEGVPQLSIQDGANIDQSRIKEDLTDITEKRAVAGCNGDSDGYGNGSCYPRGKNYWNGKTWRAGKIYYTSTPGKYYKEDWHHVDAFFRLNSIVNGKGVPDGIIRYWYDGELVIDVNNAMIRTGQHPDMKFNQFVMGPYIGDGSPVDQTFWIDNLELSTTPPGE